MKLSLEQFSANMAQCYACEWHEKHPGLFTCSKDNVNILYHAKEVGCPIGNYKVGGCLDNLMRGAKGVTNALLKRGNTNPVDRLKREAICGGCDHAVKTAGAVKTCDLCGCMLWAKIKRPNEHCPIGKWKSVADNEKWFGHTGDLGDIIYSLPVIREMGGGSIYLHRDSEPSRTHKMTPARAAAIVPLLELQPYIKEAVFIDSDTEEKHRLDSFRNWGGKCDLIECHYRALGMPYTYPDTPWLTVDHPVEATPVIFARSQRHRGEHGASIWSALHARYASQATFVGTVEEWKAFQFEVGPVEFIPTANLLEAARVIAGCELFCGNQSAPFAIAEGLRKPTILEVFYRLPNCCFPRANAIHLMNVPHRLPEITALSDRSTSELPPGRIRGTCPSQSTPHRGRQRS